MKYKSDAFESIHQSATAMHKVGAIDQETMQEFDEGCLIAPEAQGLTDAADTLANGLKMQVGFLAGGSDSYIHAMNEAFADIDKLRDLATPKHGAHPDESAVDAFAEAMKEKLEAARAKGRDGWQGCTPDELSRMLREHVEKGDPRDVANFCMFLWHMDAPISERQGNTARDLRIRAAMERFDREGTLPGMIASFEQQFGQTWADPEWQQESSIWASAWHAARAAAPLAATRPAPAEDVRDAKLPHIPIRDLLRIYDQQNGDWCGIAREVERRTIAAMQAATPAAVQDEPEDNAAFDAKVEEIREYLGREQSVYLSRPSVRKLVSYAQVAPSPEQSAEAVRDVFREALAWGRVYGEAMAPHQWDEMRDKMAEQFAGRLAHLTRPT